MATFNSGSPAAGASSASWALTMRPMLRAIIGDLDETKYTDARLDQVLCVAAYDVNSRATFLNDYTISVVSKTMSPDPVDQGDEDFTVLTVYKAACIILGSEVKTEANGAVAIKDGPSSVDLRGIAANLAALQNNICSIYEDLLNKYRFEKGNGDGTSLGAAILSPYSPGSWGVRDDGTHVGRIF